MFIAVQFPFVDARRFAAELPTFAGPRWPTPRVDLNPEFLRQFGPAQVRLRGADAAWVDEYVYCNAKRAIRFRELRAARLGRGDHLFVPSCNFRRFFYDGMAVARVEVGLSHDSWRGGALRNASDADLMAIIAGLFRLPTQTGGTDSKSVTRELILQGPHLARLYATASVRAGRESGARLVRSGIPTALVEFDSFQVTAAPLNAVDVSEATADERITLWFSRLQTQYGAVPTWFIGSTPPSDRGVLRSLRLNLLRLHAEQQALNEVLAMVAAGEISYEAGTPAGDRLEEYLNRATRIVSRDLWRGVLNSAILGALDATTNVANPAQQAIVEQRLQGMRRQIERKVSVYQEERFAKTGFTSITVLGDYMNQEQRIYGGTFHGPVVNAVTAGKIEESFNTVKASDSSAEVKDALTALHTEVAKLVEAMASEGVGDPDEVVNQLETFSKQAVEKRPLRDVLKSTGGGLIEAAKFVAASAGPVAAAVTAVLKATGVT